jgi:hypothetical protein
MDWVVYRNWVCAGGTQRTAVRLAQWPAGIDPPDPLRSPLDYDTEQGLLSCVGALPAHVLERWLAASDDEAFQAAVRRLHRESHVAPISDVNAYNSGEAGLETHRVRDLMVEFALHWRSGQGTFVVEMTDGDRVFDAVFDFGSGELVLYADGEPQPVRRVKRPAVSAHDEALIQVSTFDSQVVVAVDGTPLCEPCEYERGPIRDRALRRPVRFGARDVDVHIRHVRLFRDVYYTPGPEPAKTSYAVGRGEYLVLGDNSRVSIDSRHWDRPGVPEELLIGKPLAVHLPSKSGALRWGERTWRVRIPDISRMRYIR